jgi:hypothetical protein
MMHLWKHARRCWHTLAMAALVATTLAAPAWAAPKKKEEKAPEQTYLLPYILTCVAVGMGVAVICYPSTRKSDWEPKKD